LPVDENALAVAGRDGDAKAFSRLYEITAPDVYRYCYSRTRNAADAEDLLQQTFLRVVEALPRYEDRGVPFRAWLFRICRTVSIDIHRRERPHLSLDAGTHVDPPSGAAPDRRLSDVLEAVESLPEGQRTVIELRFFADLSARDAGLVMGRDEAAVRALQMRALAALRRRLAADQPVGSDLLVPA